MFPYLGQVFLDQLTFIILPSIYFSILEVFCDRFQLKLYIIYTASHQVASYLTPIWDSEGLLT